MYQVSAFGNGLVVMDDFNDQEIMVVGSNSRNFLTAYYVDGLESVSYLSDSAEIVAEDNNGNKISVSGKILEGPLAGTQLQEVESILGYYFSLAAFYPDIEIHQ